MGLRGPAPQPTSIRVLNGNPGRRAINTTEPQPRPVKPHCPAHLDDEAKKEWKRLSPILQRMRVLTEADYIALANLCVAYSTLIKAQSALSKTGLLVKTPSGYVQQSPLVSIVRSQMEMINRLCGEFGLTPSSRSRIQIQPEKPKMSVTAQLLAMTKRA
jgi:P27 family predicted phage terminase small subunit